MSSSEGAALRRVVLHLVATPGKARMGLGWIASDGRKTAVRTFTTHRGGGVATAIDGPSDMGGLAEGFVAAAASIKHALEAIGAAINSDDEERSSTHGVPD